MRPEPVAVECISGCPIGEAGSRRSLSAAGSVGSCERKPRPATDPLKGRVSHARFLFGSVSERRGKHAACRSF
jgi:hypothetical protein